jgi:hypothetical protein
MSENIWEQPVEIEVEFESESTSLVAGYNYKATYRFDGETYILYGSSPERVLYSAQADIYQKANFLKESLSPSKVHVFQPFAQPAKIKKVGFWHVEDESIIVIGSIAIVGIAYLTYSILNFWTGR